jgi:DNA replication protein DnaC
MERENPLIKINEERHCVDCGTALEMRAFDVMGETRKIPFHVCDCKNQYNYIEALKASGIPERYIKKPLKDWITLPGSSQMVDTIKKYSNNLKENIQNYRGLILIGKTGTGKTKIISWLLKKIIKEIKCKCVFVSVPAISIRITSTPDDSEEIRNYMKKLIGAKILVLDDIGEGDTINIEFLSNIIEIREENKKITFFTSKKNIDELKEVYRVNVLTKILSLSNNNIGISESDIDMRNPINKERYLK